MPPSQLASKIGRRVRELRLAERLTLDQLAERAGLPTDTVGRIERGRTPSLPSLEMVARGLGVAVVDLFGDGLPEKAYVEGEVPLALRGLVLRLQGCSAEEVEWVKRVVEVVLEGRDRNLGCAVESS